MSAARSRAVLDELRADATLVDSARGGMPELRARERRTTRASACRAATALAVAEPAREQRKVVTVLFCDLVGSTALGESTDPEALRARMRRYFEDLRVILERHGGTVEKFVGDAVMAVFGIPVSHEDDALRAVRAAAEMRAAIAEHGLEAGSASTRARSSSAARARRSSPATPSTSPRARAGGRRAARSSSAPRRGCSSRRRSRRARRAARAEGEVGARRGVPAPRGDQRRRAARTPPRDAARRPRARAPAALARLRGRGRRPHVPALHAPRPGRHRQVAPRRRLPRARRRLGRRPARPLPLVRRGHHLLAARRDPDRDRRRARTRSSARRRPRRSSPSGGCSRRGRPSGRRSWSIDDLQWAEPVFVDLVEHIADFSRDAPIFLLCVARTELLDSRPGWGGGKLNATSLLLEPLGADECAELMERLVADAPLDAELRERITTASAGNPLYVEEMLAMVREHGGDGEIVVPPTIHALLQARIDSLDGDVRVVMERGSVEGEVFHRGAVAELSPDPVRAGGRVAPRDARAQGADPLDVADVPRGRGLPLPPSAHPRCGVRVAAEGDARRAARALRRLARDARPRRARRDRRLPPRAGASLPSRARRGDPALADLAAPRVRPSRCCGPRRAGPRRLQRGALAAPPRGRAPPPETIRRARALAPDLALALWEAGELDEARRLLARGAQSPAIRSARAIATRRRDLDRLHERGLDRATSASRSARRRAQVLEAAGDDEGLALLLVERRGETWVELRAAGDASRHASRGSSTCGAPG